MSIDFWELSTDWIGIIWVQLGGSEAECDISVSKLLGFETFPFFLMVSVSVSKNFGFEKSIGIGFEKKWYQKKVSDSVSFKF